MTQIGKDILSGDNPLNRISIPTISDAVSVVNAARSAITNDSVGSVLAQVSQAVSSNGESVVSKYIPANAGVAINAIVTGVSALGKTIANTVSSSVAKPASSVNPVTETWSTMSAEKRAQLISEIEIK